MKYLLLLFPILAWGQGEIITVDDYFTMYSNTTLETSFTELMANDTAEDVYYGRATQDSSFAAIEFNFNADTISYTPIPDFIGDLYFYYRIQNETDNKEGVVYVTVIEGPDTYIDGILNMPCVTYAGNAYAVKMDTVIVDGLFYFRVAEAEDNTGCDVVER